MLGGNRTEVTLRGHPAVVSSRKEGPCGYTDFILTGAGAVPGTFQVFSNLILSAAIQGK